MGTVRAGIGRQINLAIRGAFVAILAVGGISVLLAWAIATGVEEGFERSREVEAIDRIHSAAHHFLGDLQLVLQGGRLPAHRSPEQTLKTLQRQIAAYQALERAQGDDESRQELARLGELSGLVAQLETVALSVVRNSAAGRPPTTAELTFLNTLAHERLSGIIEELHTVHQRKFRRVIEGIEPQMLWIAALYVAFAVGGGLLLLFGDRFLSRRLVMPITRLAEAARQIAGGDLSRRVPVRSGDEVGQLSQAFNAMAERLEAHEAERLSFETELERQVRERTRELEETTARLRATQVQLIRSERIAVTGQIAAGVTHEIRTPLNSLAINVQLLRRELAKKATPASLGEIPDTLAAVEYEITRINRILEEFVNFARLPTPRFGRVEVVPLLQEILGLLGPQAAAAGVKVSPLATDATPTVRGDQDQLRQVFLNLAQNALQAMPSGGVLGVEVAEDREWVEISVADSGPGIPDAERELVFLPFVSTKADGLGLGLPIVRRIAEEHGGSVSCRNRPEGGAVFTVRLPGTTGHGR